MDKEIFQKKLQKFMIEKAGQTFDAKDVEVYFQDEQLTREQISLILDYAGEKRQESSLLPEEQEYLKGYLSALDEAMEESWEGRNRSYLKFAAGEAVKYHDGSLSLEDLIQEAGLGLAAGLLAAEGAKDPDAVIKECIRRELSRACQESSSAQSDDRRMVEKVRALDESLTRLEKDLGRKVYPEEIAADMGVSEEEVRDIIKLTGEDTGEEGGTQDAGTERN